MRRTIILLLGLSLLALASPVAGGSQEVPLETVRGHLRNAHIAEAPQTVGKRSPIGPQVYRRVVDSVILVVTETGFGTGVLVTPQGHVLTNAHVVGKNEVVWVVSRSPELLKSKAMDRLRKEDVILAQVVAVDVRRDLALLHMQSVPAGLRSAPLGEAGAVEVGQDVYSIGHPRGLLWSYAEGVVSQVRPDYEWVYDDAVPRRATVLQTQTPTHSGSSGGALFDGAGRIVGINAYTAKEPTLSFAIAVGEVRDWVQSLVKR